MALDTVDKRRAIHQIYPLPDGSLGRADRIHMMGLFRVLLTVTPLARILTVAAESRLMSVLSESRTLTVEEEPRTVTA